MSPARHVCASIHPPVDRGNTRPAANDWPTRRDSEPVRVVHIHRTANNQESPNIRRVSFLSQLMVTASITSQGLLIVIARAAGPKQFHQDQARLLRGVYPEFSCSGGAPPTDKKDLLAPSGRGLWCITPIPTFSRQGGRGYFQSSVAEGLAMTVRITERPSITSAPVFWSSRLSSRTKPCASIFFFAAINRSHY